MYCWRSGSVKIQYLHNIYICLTVFILFDLDVLVLGRQFGLRCEVIQRWYKDITAVINASVDSEQMKEN